MKATKIYDLDVDRLHEVLDYDPETGVFTWRVRLSPRGGPGEIAGFIDGQGYRVIGIDGRRYLANQLAWLHFYQDAPEEMVTSINKDKADCRIANLRLATHTESARYRKKSALNSTGLKGAAKFNSDRNLKKYRASIRVGDRRIHLGQFATPEEAHKAYRDAAIKHFGEFARTDD